MNLNNYTLVQTLLYQVKHGPPFYVKSTQFPNKTDYYDFISNPVSFYIIENLAHEYLYQIFKNSESSSKDDKLLQYEEGYIRGLKKSLFSFVERECNNYYGLFGLELFKKLSSDILQKEKYKPQFKSSDFEEWEKLKVTYFLRAEFFTEYLRSIFKVTKDQEHRGYIAGLKYAIDLIIALEREYSSDKRGSD